MIREGDKKLKEAWKNRFQSLPEDSKAALKAALLDLRSDALKRAQYCWKKHKAPMALYWKVVGVYAGHISRIL